MFGTRTSLTVYLLQLNVRRISHWISSDYYMFPISDPEHPRRRFPIVNIALIAISIAVFLYQFLILDDSNLTRFYNNYGVVPYELTGQGDISLMVEELKENNDRTVLGIEGVLGTLTRHADHTFGVISIHDIRNVYEGGPPSPWFTLLTSMFIHGGWLHLIGNMLFLWVFGDNLENRLGRFKYLFFYLISGFFATACQVAVNLNTGIPTIGASGAVAGVLGGYFVLFPHAQIRTLIFFFLITVVSIPAWILIGVWIIMQFFNGFISLGGEFADGVAYWAHIGGFIAGFLITVAFVGLARFKRVFHLGYK